MSISLTAWTLRDRVFHWGKQTYLMGVLNVTPDSFSDGGQYNTLRNAFKQASQMVKDGIDILDIGGQSTRPSAELVSPEEELDRVVPVIDALRREPEFAHIPISVDTMRSQVAKAAVGVGADFVNDISGAAADPAMLPMVGELGVPIALMHMRGTPTTMQTLTDYDDLMGEIQTFLATQTQRAKACGIQQFMIDPGIGFAKTYEQNLTILRELQQLQTLNAPILVGPSRKSFIGHILNQPDPQKRVLGTVAACVSAIANGADVVRVHDIPEVRDACRVADAIWRHP
jgi:dihydropteroate synthase